MEALTAVRMALKMKVSQKYEKAKKLFHFALQLQPLHPDVLNHYGEFLGENEIIEADQCYCRALISDPRHSRALANRERTSPVVEAMDEEELDKILEMKRRVPLTKKVERELYFLQIYHSAAIEGNTMTLAETKALIETRTNVPEKSATEHNEILGLESALRHIADETLIHKDVISVLDILEIHGKVLGHSNPNEAGSFRRTQVYVGKHTPPAASDVTNLMEEFVDWLKSEEALKLNPVKQAALAHFKLVNIHPFGDGNGRTARLLTNLILVRNGYPPVIIKKQERSRYFNTIELAHEGDPRPFIRFIARVTERTLNVYLLAAKKKT